MIHRKYRSKKKKGHDKESPMDLEMRIVFSLS